MKRIEDKSYTRWASTSCSFMGLCFQFQHEHCACRV